MAVRKSSAIFGAVVVALLIVCMGLLIALLKNQPPKDSKSDTEVFTPTSITAGTTDGTTTTGPADRDYRLSDDVIPLHYNVRLHPDLDSATFQGTVDIRVMTTGDVNNFTVHVHKPRLTVTSSVVKKEGDINDLADITLDDKDDRDFHIVKLKSTATKGNYTLSFTFRGDMSGTNVGFYRSTYKDGDQTRHLATSKFQPTYARRAFPCFDEPKFKSEFTVTLVHKKDMIALSNMPAIAIKDLGGELSETSFKTSVPMVTYLACFIVCDFHFTSRKTSSNIEFRVYATPAQKEKTKFALNAGVQILDYYEDYFNISYPLPKQDMIAIPDFSSGAMEHWGLITFREANLLIDEKESSAQNEQRVATVVSHELAHMWFGNLVTMKWWDDLWLNEGFASYVEYKGVNVRYPEWNIMDQFVTEDLQPVMRLDATTSSHPIIQPVKNPDEITEIFDIISYNKGAAVLRMLENFVTPEIFRSGISQFLKNHIYGNANTTELWDEIDAVYQGKETISDIMDTWTKQMGFPVVSVKRTSNETFLLQQKRFLTNPTKGYSARESPYRYIWKIPIQYVTSKSRDSKLIWLTDDKEMEISIPGLSNDDWVKFNHNQTGYYLVNYETAEWNRFSKILMQEHKSLSPSDRSSLLFDAFLLAQSQTIKYDVPLNLVKGLVNEEDLTPWETAYSCLVQLGNLFPDAHFKDFLRDLTSPLYRKLGWKQHNDHVSKLLQTTIVGLACYSGNEQCKQEAADKMKTMMHGKDADVPLSLRNTLFHYAMEMGGSVAEWEYLWSEYQHEESAQERLKLLYGMARVKDHELIRRLLRYAMDPEMIRTQDFFTVLTYIAGNPDGRDIVWLFVQEKWEELVARFTINERYLGRAVKSICDYFNTQEKLDEMEKFFHKYPHAGAGTLARQQALENVRNNIFWMKTHQSAVDHWLKEEGDVPFSKYRLSGDVVPEHYDLRLQPYLEEGLFDGSVSVTVKVIKATRFLILHAHLLKITDTRVQQVQGLSSATDVLIRSAFPVPENQFWVIELERSVKRGVSLVLSFKFNGSLTAGGLSGFYRSSYRTAANETRYLATSQFQSTYARQAFPCFDEPQFKTTFTVTLVHENNYTALSNMPEEAKTGLLNTNLVETRFEKSIKMVTYLVCVIVSDFESREAMTSNGKLVRVFARPDEKNRTEYALQIGVKTLEFFQTYFKIPYPLPKLDMIAIPDFQAGAMENWGLVTYRETLLLFDVEETSSYSQLRIDAVIGHELAHMWFGNLVTMKWWDDLWLNEGFASYMEYKSMADINPTWDVDAQFFFEDTHRVLIPDASPSSHPIVQSVNHPDEISAIFDAISYSKGASVLRMLEFFLGSPAFTKGVTAYLTKFTLDNAVTADLWEYLKHAAGDLGQDVDVAKIMDSWTRQMGYPYINVSRIDQDSNYITYMAKPARFLIDPHIEADNTSAYGYKWEIPLSYRTFENADKPVIQWISSNQTGAVVKVQTKEWAKFNSDSKGYYLVNYGDDWITIINQLRANHEVMSASDRANLISDAFLLARGGLTSYESALNLTTYLKNERHFVPWETAKRSLSFLQKAVKHDKDLDDQMKSYLDRLTKDALASLGWKDDIANPHLDRRLRATLVEMACDSGNKECLIETGKMLKDWMTDGKRISSNLRLLAHRFGMQTEGDDKMWNFMLQKYKTESSSQVQRDLLNGLASSNNTKIIEKFLNMAKDDNLIRRQDYFTALGYVAANPVGLPLVWNYVRANWVDLVKRFGLNDRYLGEMVKTVCSHFSTEDKLAEMVEFFAKYPEAGAGERARQEALQTVKNAITWLSQHKSAVKTWLNKPWHNVRLTRSVKPIHYDVKLHPDIENATFQGSVSIQVEVSSVERYLLVHSHLLNVLKVSVTDDENNTVVDLFDHFPQPSNDYWVMEAQTEFTPGNYTIKMEFTGVLEGLVGFYRSSYIDSTDNKKKYLATSQFQSTYARRAFPCFDEPSFKSTFTITLVHHENMTALSNMPEVSRNVINDSLVETQFNTSVPMVTYLVCVIVCDFDYVNMTTTNGIELRVYAPPDRIGQADFSLDIGNRVLTYFEDYFKIPFPLPKLDMIALPDFRAGAMENWGLITYRELYLLFDKNETSPSVEFSIAMIIAHEIAHMWFGNLVTMEWWDDLWLNEGFATHMAYKCVHKIRPDMDGVGMFLLQELSKVLERDATWSSHPIVTTVHNPDEISAIFDAISYSKGASVLRKLENFLTPDKFSEGVNNYLKNNSFKNAKTGQLWDELSAVTKTNVTEVMDTWTRQMGYPVVKITRTSDSTFHATQQRFLMNPDANSSQEFPSPYNYTWRIPLQYKVDNDPQTHLTWFNTKEGVLDVASSTKIKWNADYTGYYFVNYDEDEWKMWAEALQNNDSMLESTDRSNLLSDAFYLASAGHLNYELALNLTVYLEDVEDDYQPWTTGKSEILQLHNQLKMRGSPEKMLNFMKKLSEPKFTRFGWNDDPSQEYLERRLRVTVVDLACRANNPACLAKAADLLKKYIESGTSIPSALRSLAYRYGIMQDTTLWDQLWNKYLTMQSAQERRDMLFGLAYTTDNTTLQKYLNLAKITSNVREQDFFTVLNNIASNPHGLDLAWDFYRNEWDFLVNRYTINDGSLGGAFLSITSHFASQEKIDEMKQFVKERPDAGAGKADREEAFETVESNIRWLDKYQTTIQAWLDKQGP